MTLVHRWPCLPSPASAIPGLAVPDSRDRVRAQPPCAVRFVLPCRVHQRHSTQAHLCANREQRQFASHRQTVKSSRNVKPETRTTPETSPTRNPRSVSSRSKVSRVHGTPPRRTVHSQKAICSLAAPPKQRGERTQKESNHRENGSSNFAESCGRMLADGVFVSETGRDGTDRTDKTDAFGGSVGIVSSRSGHP